MEIHNSLQVIDRKETYLTKSCSLCDKALGDKIIFCPNCKEEAHYAHPGCIEKERTSKNSIICACGTLYEINYNGTSVEDYILRSMTETFAICVPEARRYSIANFIVVKHSLLLFLAFLLCIVYGTMLCNSENVERIVAAAIIYSAFLLSYLCACLFSTKSETNYVMMFGGFRRARTQLCVEFFFSITISGLCLGSTACVNTLRYLEPGFLTFYVFCNVILVPTVSFLLCYSKYKTYRRINSVQMCLVRS